MKIWQIVGVALLVALSACQPVPPLREAYYAPPAVAMLQPVRAPAPVELSAPPSACPAVVQSDAKPKWLGVRNSPVRDNIAPEKLAAMLEQDQGLTVPAACYVEEVGRALHHELEGVGTLVSLLRGGNIVLIPCTEEMIKQIYMVRIDEASHRRNYYRRSALPGCYSGEQFYALKTSSGLSPFGSAMCLNWFGDHDGDEEIPTPPSPVATILPAPIATAVPCCLVAAPPPQTEAATTCFISVVVEGQPKSVRVEVSGVPVGTYATREGMNRIPVSCQAAMAPIIHLCWGEGPAGFHFRRDMLAVARANIERGIGNLNPDRPVQFPPPGMRQPGQTGRTLLSLHFGAAAGVGFR